GTPRFGDRQTDIHAGGLQRRNDVCGGIDHCPVPVEHQEFECRNAHAASCSIVGNCRRKLASSSGRGAFSRISSEDCGCLKPNSAACRNIRFSPCLASSLFSAKSPYLSSPAMGKPRWDRWTRI